MKGTHVDGAEAHDEKTGTHEEVKVPDVGAVAPGDIVVALGATVEVPRASTARPGKSERLTGSTESGNEVHQKSVRASVTLTEDDTRNARNMTIRMPRQSANPKAKGGRGSRMMRTERTTCIIPNQSTLSLALPAPKRHLGHPLLRIPSLRMLHHPTRPKWTNISPRHTTPDWTSNSPA